ncbi:gamma-glutamylcyclotransferase family protein [Candidatus Pelagibacter sp. HIMB1493]|uniref:gamma-glutamylcyclotransferase family protein n=1 Tax=Candidatus Pelagibacter sp. HIMB1493 TaxID=3413334 RepID=UPI003F854743
MIINSLFVYGSLQPGESNENYLKHLEGTWKQGFVLGNLFKKGWGNKIGFPVIQLNKSGEKVSGWLLESDNLQNNLKMLDDFEGKEYRRSTTNVYLNDGSIQLAYIYELNE